MKRISPEEIKHVWEVEAPAYAQSHQLAELEQCIDICLLDAQLAADKKNEADWLKGFKAKFCEGCADCGRCHSPCEEVHILNLRITELGGKHD